MQPARKSNTRNIIIIIVIIIIIIAILAYAYAGTGSIGRPSNVVVSGQATTNGFSTHAVSISFTSDTGQLYTAAVVNNQYSVTLPNGHTYSVEISGQGALGYSGTCSAGSFSINQGPGSSGLTENWSC